MDSETDTDTHSLCDSEASRENYKSPESSDCEGYATPLASSLTDLSSPINLPEDADLESGERTPVSRAISPPVVKQIIYLQKPKILVMTQREIESSSSEEEFYDVVDDVQIRDVAQRLLNGVENAEEDEEVENEDVINDYEERPDTPIMDEDSEASAMEIESVVTDEDAMTPVQVDELEEDSQETETEDSTVSQKEDCAMSQEAEQVVGIPMENVDEEDMESEEVEAIDIISEAGDNDQEIEDQSQEEIEQLEVHDVEEELETEAEEDLPALDSQEVPNLEPVSSMAQDTVPVPNESLPEIPTDVILDAAPLTQTETCDNKETANNVIAECVHNCEKLEEPEKVDVPELEIEMEECKMEEKILLDDASGNILEADKDIVVLATIEEHLDTKEVIEAIVEEVVATEAMEINGEIIQNQNLTTDRPEVLYESMPVDFSEIILAKTPLPEVQIPSEGAEVTEQPQIISNQESDPMPILVISDEVKTTPTRGLYERLEEVKVDFDGYSSGKEESLSSSTSSESFEFAEPVPHVQDERTQALRNSIIERYPSNETDDDELDDDVGDDFDEDLLAVKQISAEVEQLVAAINAFGRDEEQQMSAYLVGKKMENAEKKRKSAMDMVVTSHDQTVQTNNDSFILVEMESLQVEIDKLQADLEAVKNGEKELLKINSKLKEDLEESQQTIDGIEVEAEQQYTELTSEIDELYEVINKKDQDLAGLKEKIANLSVSESNLRDDVDSQRIIVQRQKEIIESLREELDTITKKLVDVTKLRDKAIEEVTVYKLKNQERDRFLSREAQMSMEIEDLQRELNKQKLILNHTSMAKLADTFDRKVLHLENELRERDMLICKQNQIINNHRKSPTGSVITSRKMQPRTSVLAASGNMPSAGSSSESFQHGLDSEAKEALFSFMLCDRHQQLANIYNIGRILDLTSQEERTLERHLTKDRFT